MADLAVDPSSGTAVMRIALDLSERDPDAPLLPPLSATAPAAPAAASASAPAAGGAPTSHTSLTSISSLPAALPPRLPTPRTTGQDVFLTTGVPWAYAPGRRYSPLPLPAPSPLAVGGAWSRWSPLPGSPALFSPLLPSDVGGWKGGVPPAPGSAAPGGGGAEPTTPVLLSDLNSMAFGRRAGGEGRRVEAGLGW